MVAKRSMLDEPVLETGMSRRNDNDSRSRRHDQMLTMRHDDHDVGALALVGLGRERGGYEDDHDEGG